MDCAHSESNAPSLRVKARPDAGRKLTLLNPRVRQEIRSLPIVMVAIITIIMAEMSHAVYSPPPQRFGAAARSGGALIETMVAMAIAAIFLSGVHLTNSQVMVQVRSSLESVAASRDLSSRTEQLRASTWSQVTDSAYLKDTVLAGASDAGGDLGNLVETIEVTAHLAPTGTVAPITVRRNSNGAVIIVNAGDGTMRNQPSVRIDVTADWTAKGGRSRTRQTTLIIGQGGIVGRH